MKCNQCGADVFVCGQCKAEYDFRLADRQIDLDTGESVLVTWVDDLGQPTRQIHLSEDTVEGWEWSRQVHHEADRHIEALYEAMGYRPGEETEDPFTHLGDLVTDAQRVQDAESIMQDFVDFLAVRHQDMEEAESRIYALRNRVAAHLGEPFPL